MCDTWQWIWKQIKTTSLSATSYQSFGGRKDKYTCLTEIFSLFIYSLIHAWNKHLLSVHYILVAVIGNIFYLQGNRLERPVKLIDSVLNKQTSTVIIWCTLDRWNGNLTYYRRWQRLHMERNTSYSEGYWSTQDRVHTSRLMNLPETSMKYIL